MTADPALRILSLGAGVQSSALLILAARGDLPPLDAAIFSDTGWEPAAVYEHLARLEEEVAKPAGIPIYRVTAGNIRADALDPAHRFASMPLFTKGPCQRCKETGMYRGRGADGRFTRVRCTNCKGTGTAEGITRRQCTSEYKLKPIKQKTRELLGAQPKPNGVPGRVPKGRFAEQWIGISTDERDRALDEDGELKTGDVLYSRNRYPLLELGFDRALCRSLLDSHGFGKTPKSACIGCPFHTNAHWRMIRENPADWADAVDFDARIRGGGARANANGSALRGEAFLHRSMVPLAEAPIERDSFKVWAGRQGDVLQMLSVAEYEEKLSAEDRDGLTGCSPFSCPN
ncbi:hypothetical protein SEA_AOKA_36 [Arthrobacter phage Aoka]|nr:hypothetical protein SEA_AOKA_36 [Arthrobacter phage Aoka]